MISHLNQEISNYKVTVSSLQLRAPTKQKQPRVDTVELDRANKAAQNIEQLERLLSQRTEEYEQAMNDLSIFEQTCQQLEAEKMQMLEELEAGRELIEQQEVKLIEQEQLIMKMGTQLSEVEEFKAALAEQEVKQKIRENFGVTESQMERSESHSSFTDQSQFTALKSARNQTFVKDSAS